MGKPQSLGAVGPRPTGQERTVWRRDPILAVSAGLVGLCLLLGAAALLSSDARAFYEAGFAAMYEAMAGMAAACQWTY